jgi:hypothetical protein
MSAVAKQAILLAVGGLGIVYVALRLARKRLLTARYAMGWMCTGVLVICAAAAMPFVGRIGQLANMSPTAVLLSMGSIVLLTVTIQLSISVSQLQNRLRSVAEAHALLVADLEQAGEHG